MDAKFAAVECIELQAHASQPGVEVDAKGVVTGRLFRLDDWLQNALPVIWSPISNPIR